MRELIERRLQFVVHFEQLRGLGSIVSHLVGRRAALPWVLVLLRLLRCRSRFLPFLLCIPACHTWATRRGTSTTLPLCTVR